MRFRFQSRSSRILSALAPLLCLAGSAIAEASEPRTSPWRAVKPGAAAWLRETDQGVEITTTTGDIHGRSADAQAIFMRTPVHQPPYWFQATLPSCHPQAEFAQAGLVAYGDDDHYVRLMAGFVPHALECLGEFGGKPSSKGTFPIYPDNLSKPVHLRMEVLTRSIRGYASFDGKKWLALGGFTLPDGRRCADLIKGIGILGVGGAMESPPRFTGWTEKPITLSPGTDLLRPSNGFLIAQGNSGWGREDISVQQSTGGLTLTSYSGSDIFFGYEPYSFLGQPAPQDATWELELKVRSFDPTRDGAFHKAGIVLWQDNDTFLNVGAVADKQFNQLYLEALATGKSTVSRQWGWHDLSPTDIYVRLARTAPTTFQISTSYDGKQWETLEPIEADLPEPQLRLMTSGDVFMQYPDQRPTATFEYLKRNDIGKETSDGN